MAIKFTYDMAVALMELFYRRDQEIVVCETIKDSGEGLYAWHHGCPEDAVFLGPSGVEKTKTKGDKHGRKKSH